MLTKRKCVPPPAQEPTLNVVEPQDLPSIDVFLNPAKAEYKDRIASEKKDLARNYFKSADMATLFPRLFRILWQSTLPCFQGNSDTEHMLLSCQLAGSNVNCSELFRRVPTDIGMCCALNSADSLRESSYKKLIKTMQGDARTRLVESKEGLRNGLRLTLDLHSNTVSFGTLEQEYDAFKVFIGQPAEFPMMKEKGIRLEPGREHFIDLSASVVSTSGIEGIHPEARECFFSNEGDLDFYNNYTFTNCKLECAIKRANRKYNCVPWHLPKVRNSLIIKSPLSSLQGDGDDWKTCDPWTAKNFTDEMENFSDCPHCRADCELTTFSTSITSTPFRLTTFSFMRRHTSHVYE